MIILDSTTRSLQAVLSGVVATTEPSFVCSYVDITSTTFLPGTNDGNLNGVTAVALMAAPSASTQRQLKYMAIYNADTAPVTVKLQYNDNSTLINILVITLAIGYRLEYASDSGFKVYDTNGCFQTVGTAGLNGINAFTATTSNFTQPTTYAVVSVVSTSWMAQGQVVYANDSSNNGGYYRVLSISSSTTVALTNLAYTGNSSIGTTILSGASIVPAGIIGSNGINGTNGISDFTYSTNN